MSQRDEIVKVIGAVMLPQLGGWVNGYLTRQEIKGWYQKLNFPSCRPPNWIFGPVWTSLYAGMGFASYLVWRDGNGFDGVARGPLILYGVQLALNWGWTPIFFKLHNLKWSLVELGALSSAVAITGFAFFNVNKVAGYLFIPYFAWCSFATWLNYKFFELNPESTATIEEIKENKKK
ncbi:translocator protein [Malaya genurostris]|uniref:translocator protein n=1 Tax=Malaya genurostris TaxID=325434 RepID=UPI0026F39FB9|nr:translocator protein [Malaya genurostris]